MNSDSTGAVVINQSIAEDVTAVVIRYIEQALGNLPDNFYDLLQEPPVVICRNVTEAAAREMVARLTEFGVSAMFIPDQIGRNEQHLPRAEFEKTVSALPDRPAWERQPLPEETRFMRYYPHGRRTRIVNAIMEANKELWIILSVVVLAGLINLAVASQYLLLGLYTLPTIMSAYFFGRRQAVMTAFASFLAVGIIAHISPGLFEQNTFASLGANSKWYHISSWGCILLITAYAMGTLYERNKAKLQELRSTYQGLLVILRHFISQDEYTENHCYRVSIYAAKIAARMGMDEEFIQDVRSAALLHDIGKLKVSREILYKAAKLSMDDRVKIEKHVDNGAGILEPMRGPLGRILPMVLGHHDKFDGSGYREFSRDNIPIGARILAVADVYDALVSDRPYRKAMSPFEVKEIIVQGRGKEFDPTVVAAFVVAFDRREMEVPNVII